MQPEILENEELEELENFFDKTREIWRLPDREISKTCKMNIPGGE
jgi:hypothetical protein